MVAFMPDIMNLQSMPLGAVKAHFGRGGVTENALIESTEIGDGDRGFTAWVILKFEGGGQGFGGYDLSEGYGLLNWVTSVTQVAGVKRYEIVAGNPVRVYRSHNNGVIDALGHYYKDQWFVPAVHLR